MKLRAVARIARWEVSRSTAGVDRRTAVAVVVVVLALAAAGPSLADRGAMSGVELYRVGVAPDSPYYEPVVEDPRLRAVEPDVAATRWGDVEVVCDGGCAHADSEKGRAAYSRLRSAVATYNDRIMREEADQAAAFPVHVTLRYVEQNGPSPSESRNDGSAGGGDGESTGGIDQAQTGGSVGSTGGDAGDAVSPMGQSVFAAGTQSGAPSDISPPFPLRSVLLAFLFVLPMNFVSQAYGSSVIGERVNRKGEPLLVAPVSRYDIIAGKTLPYLAVAVGITAAVAPLVGGGLLTVAAIAPVALLFLGSTFVAAMLARSFKELTFVTVTASVLITTYMFVPAIFTEIHPIASISPLSVVVADLSGSPVGPIEFLFPTAPVALSAGVLFALGAGLYREEDMFTQRSVPGKTVDALAAQLRTRRSVAVWSALFIPFVLLAELLAVAVLFLAPVSVSIPAVLVVVAVVEEVAKSVHVYAGFVRARFPSTRRTALVLGGASGLGFFLGEKLTLAAQVVGLPQLDVGRAAFALRPDAGPLALAVLLVAPLALHTVTASVSALGARHSRRHYLGALAVAVAIHVGYNALVVSALV